MPSNSFELTAPQPIPIDASTRFTEPIDNVVDGERGHAIRDCAQPTSLQPSSIFHHSLCDSSGEDAAFAGHGRFVLITRSFPCAGEAGAGGVELDLDI